LWHFRCCICFLHLQVQQFINHGNNNSKLHHSCYHGNKCGVIMSLMWIAHQDVFHVLLSRCPRKWCFIHRNMLDFINDILK
jgi:hypothetical protein